MKDAALAHSREPAYYLGMLEGLVASIEAASETPTRRGNPSSAKPDPAMVRSYERVHWGNTADQVLRAQFDAPKPGETLALLGELVAIVYDTHKGNESGEYEHEFEAPRPLLTYKQNCSLIIIGGGYRITPRGIVG